MHLVQALVSLNLGGSELVATELSEFAVSRGHRVTVLAADGPLEVARMSGGGLSIGRSRGRMVRRIP